MRISKEEQIKQLAIPLKVAGFKKKAETWRRVCSDGIQVVNIQGSQWGPDYYLNLGFYISALGSEDSPTDYRCHVRARVAEPDRNAGDLSQEIERWFALNGSLAELVKRKETCSLPAMTTGPAVEYLMQYNNSLQARRP